MTSPVVFLKEVKLELERVSWPSRKKVTRLTTIIVGVSLAVAFFIGGLDFIFIKLTEAVIK